MLKAKPVPLLSAREKMPFEVTPFMPYLTRYQKPGAAISADPAKADLAKKISSPATQRSSKIFPTFAVKSPAGLIFRRAFSFRALPTDRRCFRHRFCSKPPFSTSDAGSLMSDTRGHGAGITSRIFPAGFAAARAKSRWCGGAAIARCAGRMADLLRAAAQFAANLQARGIAKGDRVLILGREFRRVGRGVSRMHVCGGSGVPWT